MPTSDHAVGPVVKSGVRHSQRPSVLLSSQQLPGDVMVTAAIYTQLRGERERFI